MKVNRTLLPPWTNGLGAIVLLFLWLEASKAFSQANTFKVSDAVLSGAAPGGSRLLTRRNNFSNQRIPARACPAEAASSPRSREDTRPILGALGESALSFLFPDGVRLWAATGVGVLLGLIAWRFRHGWVGLSRRSSRQSLSAGGAREPQCPEHHDSNHSTSHAVPPVCQ